MSGDRDGDGGGAPARPAAAEGFEGERFGGERFEPFAAAFRTALLPMVLTDPLRADNPIVFANDAFLRLTGYPADDVVGRNCRFLQGPDTDRRDRQRIARALAEGEAVSVEILNYRRDGTAFWNALAISPVRDAAGRLRCFFASQSDVTERRQALQAKTALLHEVDHRVKNSLQMASALVALQMGGVADAALRETLATMLHRIEALATLHRRLYQSEDTAWFSVDAFTHDIVTDLVAAAGRTDIAVGLDLQPIRIAAEQAAPLALIVNELVTNALKHAFADRPGRLTVRVRAEAAHLRLEVDDDGPGMGEAGVGEGSFGEGPFGEDSFGQTIMRMLARQLKASLFWSGAEPPATGTRAVLRMPLRAPGA